MSSHRQAIESTIQQLRQNIKTLKHQRNLIDSTIQTLEENHSRLFEAWKHYRHVVIFDNFEIGDRVTIRTTTETIHGELTYIGNEFLEIMPEDDINELYQISKTNVNDIYLMED